MCSINDLTSAADTGCLVTVAAASAADFATVVATAVAVATAVVVLATADVVVNIVVVVVSDQHAHGLPAERVCPGQERPAVC